MLAGSPVRHFGQQAACFALSFERGRMSSCPKCRQDFVHNGPDVSQQPKPRLPLAGKVRQVSARHTNCAVCDAGLWAVLPSWAL